MLKNISVEKSNLFAYLRFCVLFCEHKEKKKNEKAYNGKCTKY